MPFVFAPRLAEYPWVTADQVRLLRACLLPGEVGMRAWRAWEATLDLDALDPGSQRLLPLLYRRLADADVDYAHLDRLKGVYRRSWYDNQGLLRGGRLALGVLHDAGIPAMLLKGAAVVTRFYSDVGLRPMLDIDIAVRRANSYAALAVLRAAGWTPQHRGTPVVVDDGLMARRHGVELVYADGSKVDLHWRVMEEADSPEAERDLWEVSGEAELLGVSARVLSPADHLMATCIHGVRTIGLMSHLRWAADAVRLLETELIDWSRVVAWGPRFHVTLFLENALRFIAQELEAPVPPEALQALRDAPVSSLDRLIYRHWNAQGRVWQLPVPLLKHASRVRDEPLVRQAREWTEFLSRHWGASGVRQLPQLVVTKAVRRARERVAG